MLARDWLLPSALLLLATCTSRPENRATEQPGQRARRLLDENRPNEVEEQVFALAARCDVNERLTVLTELASAYCTRGDHDATASVLDSVLELPEVADNPAYRSFYEGFRADVDRLGEPLGDFRAQATNGMTIETAELRGSPLLLVYWGFW